MINRRMVMRYTGRRVCCALLSAVLITGGLPCGAGATGFPGRMTARAAVGIESLKDGKATLSEAGKATPSEAGEATPSEAEGHPVNSHEGGGHDAFPNSDGRDV